MFKLLTGSLMLALSAFSFFSYAVVVDPAPWVEPEPVTVAYFWCAAGSNSEQLPVEQFSICHGRALSSVESVASGHVVTDSSCSFNGDTTIFECSVSYEMLDNKGDIAIATQIRKKWKWFDAHNSKNDKICPPSYAPDYTRGPMPESSENPSHQVCFPKHPICPLGYHKYSIEPYGCVPIQCPEKGQGVDDITTHGKLPFGQSGTFCDGTCSYSVDAGSSSYDGAQWASGVSNGAVCGNGKFVDNANFTPEDKEGDCTTHTLSNGLTFQDCSAVSTPDEGGEDSVDPGTDSTDNQVDESEVDSPFEGMDCGTVNDKEVCVGKNIVDAIQDQNDKLKKDAAERHNKLVDQQKEISDYVESKNKHRELARADDAKQMINGLKAVQEAIVAGGTGAGGGGSSNAGVISAIDGLGKDIGETDVETDGTPSDGIESFYEPEYPNGFEDVWNKNKMAFDSSAPVTYIKQWEVSVGGSAPDMNMCFDLGPMANFGCKTFEIDPRVFPFLRIIILISTAFLCRALVMGG